MKTVMISTNRGEFYASFTTQGLARLEFPSDRVHPHRQESKLTEQANNNFADWERLTRTALECLLNGQQPKRLPPLDLTQGTEFQRSVWGVLASIPPGRTKSYAEVAQSIGKPKATRAVGRACGANPIPVLIPCHRVLAANHRLGGFSGGLGWKETLLAIEGVQVK